MKILGYANTEDGYHVCVACTTDEEKERFFPLGLSHLYEYKYADWDHGAAEDFNQPSCDRCHEPINAELGDAKATEIDKIASRMIKDVYKYMPDGGYAFDADGKKIEGRYSRNSVLDALGRMCRRETHAI